MKIKDMRIGMAVDYVTDFGEHIYAGKVVGFKKDPFVDDGISVTCKDESNLITTYSPLCLEPHMEHITTDLLAERLNELEDLVDNNKIIIIAIEEMSELTQCLTKYLRATDENLTYDFDHLHEEFADVLICMNHLKSIFGFDTQETRKRMLEKLDRAIERSK